VGIFLTSIAIRQIAKKPQPATAASWGKSLPGSPLPVSLGVPQKRERGAAQVRTDELLGTLMGMQKGNNTAKVLERSKCHECVQFSAEPGWDVLGMFLHPDGRASSSKLQCWARETFMEPAGRTVILILLLFAALVATAGAGQKSTKADSPIHVISCSIEKVEPVSCAGICFRLHSDSYSNDRHGPAAKHTEGWIWARS
jgi:hypothetical protein